MFLMKYRVSLIHQEWDDLQMRRLFVLFQNVTNICSKTIVKAKSTIFYYDNHGLTMAVAVKHKQKKKHHSQYSSFQSRFTENTCFQDYN